MDKIEAEYVPGSEEGRAPGMGDVICPACGRCVRETDMGTTHEENTDRTIEVCNDCMIEAERETGEAFDSDVLPPHTFQTLWNHILLLVEERRAAEPPRHIALLADVLGGTAWQSGGGVFLVIIRCADGRVVAVSDECICEYVSMEDLTEGQPVNSIRLL